MSYSTLILILLFLVLSSIPPSFCVYDDGCYYDQRPCTQESLFPNADSPQDCAANLEHVRDFCFGCENDDCFEDCRTCLKYMTYDTTTSCCPEGYCIPHGMKCEEGQSKVIKCCDDNGIHVICGWVDKVCCNVEETKCTSSDACCGELICAYSLTTGDNVCQRCYPSWEACSVTDHEVCCDPEYHCVKGVCQKCPLTGQHCTGGSECCYQDDICLDNKCCKIYTHDDCIVCASYLEVCNDTRSDFNIPCCYDMRCAPNGYCYCGTGDANCTSNLTCCDGYYCDTKKNNTCQYI